MYNRGGKGATVAGIKIPKRASRCPLPLQNALWQEIKRKMGKNSSLEIRPREPKLQKKRFQLNLAIPSSSSCKGQRHRCPTSWTLRAGCVLKIRAVLADLRNPLTPQLPQSLQLTICRLPTVVQPHHPQGLIHYGFGLLLWKENWGLHNVSWAYLGLASDTFLSIYTLM